MLKIRSSLDYFAIIFNIYQNTKCKYFIECIKKFDNKIKEIYEKHKLKIEDNYILSLNSEKTKRNSLAHNKYISLGVVNLITDEKGNYVKGFLVIDKGNKIELNDVKNFLTNKRNSILDLLIELIWYIIKD